MLQASLKRQLDLLDPKLCLFCQNVDSKEPLRLAQDESKLLVQTIAIERQKLRDKSDITERIINEDIQAIPDARWHKDCYSSFTSKQKRERLKNNFLKEQQKASMVNESLSIVTETEVQRTSRTTVKEVNWLQCILCQKDDKVGKLHNIMQSEFSKKVIAYCQHDLVMRVRLACVNDLIAAEGKYHQRCWVEFQRKVDSLTHGRNSTVVNDVCMDTLCSEITEGLTKGHVYTLNDIWKRYLEICHGANTEPLLKYTSRRKTFADAVIETVGPICQSVRPLNPKASLLLFPSCQSNYMIANQLASQLQSSAESSAEDDYSTLGTLRKHTSDLDIMHAAMQIAMDLEDTPGHESGWTGIDIEHSTKIIPDSLFLFLSVLFGGVRSLDPTAEKASNDKQTTAILSIAQDIIYQASNHKKLTPKHVGLGLTVHQATRSKSLVELLHLAGCSVGMDTVYRLDTSIAQEVLDRYQRNGYIYIPRGIAPYSPGQLVVCSFDNIDVLEETIDGKNTFHSTQMVIWQRCPAAKSITGTIDIGRKKALNKDQLEKLHKIEYAKPRDSRPNPVFKD
jgi:hypothetical protein